MLVLLKYTHNSPSPWFNAVPSLEELCQAVMARYDQANLQPTLNKGARGASLTKIFEKSFLKTQKFFFEKVAIFKRRLCRHVY